MSEKLGRALPLLLVALSVACASAGSTTPPGSAPSQAPSIDRTLVIGSAGEPATAAAKGLQTAGLTGTPRDQFNAGLVFEDDQEARHAELAEALPELGTSSWQVFPDGRMETTYRLKPGSPGMTAPRYRPRTSPSHSASTRCRTTARRAHGRRTSSSASS